MKKLKIRRALLSVTDKDGLVELARALADSGAELVATGNTAKKLTEAGLKIRPIEEVSGSPEAFQGRMKTLSFPVCSGILYRRGDTSDEKDLKALSIDPIDCVVVNFYPFDRVLAEKGIPQTVEEKREWIDLVDIGGPTLVRSAAKNAPDVLVLTDPSQYSEVINELKSDGEISQDLSLSVASQAWAMVSKYDDSIRAVFGPQRTKTLRYGENPHQEARLTLVANSPIDWLGDVQGPLTATELSYNNLLDASGAYQLACDLKKLFPSHASVVIVKHNNPCGVACVPQGKGAQLAALARAWEGDPISAFGGVLVFTDPIEDETAAWLSEKFVELILAPNLKRDSVSLQKILLKRKKLKALNVRHFAYLEKTYQVEIPGATIQHSYDRFQEAEELKPVTQKGWPKEKEALSQFGILVTKALKSNTIALVRALSDGQTFQLVGAGQGQPNRVEALTRLAVPRAQAVLEATGGKMEDLVMVSDAFFPFRDTVDAAYDSGVRWIIQPGGSIKDQESVEACNEHGIAMVFTGKRHFRH